MKNSYMLAEHHPLDAFFTPRHVALIGATDRAGTVGRATFENLLATSFGGTVHAVNPKRNEVLGQPAYPSLSAIPREIDLAVIATPADTVPGVIRECGQRGVRGAIILSAGFKETGQHGADLEREILAEARAARVRVVGPNCLGLMSPPTGLNATFAAAMAKPGNIAFLSQSGAMLTAVLDWSFQELVGFSAFISMGSMVDVGWGDWIDYLGQDHRTKAILIYMETVGDARSFLSAAREVALTKPIIVIKAGRTQQAAQAAASHTGSLTGSDDVLDAAFERCGVVRVNTIAELFYMAEALSKQPRPRGPRFSIVTNAGGPAVLATDALIQNGGELAQLSEASRTALNEVLPEAWSHNNPIDLLGDATAERYARTLEIVTADPASDGLLVVLTPQAMTQPTEIAQALTQYAKRIKPVLASWMGGPVVKAGEDILNRAGIPTYAYPDTAARMFTYMWAYTDRLQRLYETPSLTDEPLSTRNPAAAQAVIEAARGAGRSILTEYEAKQILEAYGIPVPVSRLARTMEEAVSAASEIGYPVVVKLHSETITHKTDVGGVQLNLRDEGDVRAACLAIESRVGAEDFAGFNVQRMEKRDGYELILGASVDPQFGPVVLFGAGGTLVEVMQDRALALPPLNSTLARRLMERTRIYRALLGVRGRPPVDQAQLEALLVRFSQLIVEQPWIAEIDINPLLASPDRLLALDARIVLHPPGTSAAQLARPAIRPYPLQYVEDWTARDGTALRFRPIRPEDEPLMVRFHESLSDRSIYLRYFQFMKLSTRVAHERLTRICFNDYDREIALVVEEGAGEDRRILAVGRLRKLVDPAEAEIGLLIIDAAQGKGIGGEMLDRLIAIGRQEGVREIRADVHGENAKMLHLIRKRGFAVTVEPGDTVYSGTLALA